MYAKKILELNKEDIIELIKEKYPDSEVKLKVLVDNGEWGMTTGIECTVEINERANL